MEDRTFELLEKMYAEFLGFKKEMVEFKGDMTDFKDDMTGFKEEMIDFKKDMTGFKDDVINRLEKVELKQSKMEVVQEKVSADIKIIADVQANHMEQNERQHKEIVDVINKKTSLTEAAVRHLAGETTMNIAELSILKERLG